MCAEEGPSENRKKLHFLAKSRNRSYAGKAMENRSSQAVTRARPAGRGQQGFGGEKKRI
jgi:hypothetical protein